MTSVALPLFDIDSEWRPPDVGSLPSWSGAKRVGVDVETRDPSLGKLGPGVRRKGSYVVGVSFALEDGEAFYLPVRHACGDNVDPEQAWRYLRDQAREYEGIVVGHNLQYDLDWLAQNGVEFPKAKRFRDTLIAAPLLYELHKSYTLDSLAKRAKLPLKDEEHLRRAAHQWRVDPKNEMWKLPARHVGAYGEHDAVLPLKILRKQERELEDNGLWEIYELESRVLPALVRMIRRGVRVDLPALGKVAEWTYREEAKALAVVKAQTGVTLSPGTPSNPTGDVWKAEACAKALVADGVQVPTTPKTNRPSVDNKLLQGHGSEASLALLRARKVNKLRTTFCASIEAHAVNGRIHCTFNQLKRDRDDGRAGVKGTRSGRLSADHPNLQQQPGDRDPELAKLIRRVYVPEEGKLWAGPDLSQQEPRMAVHFAYRAKCTGSQAAVDQYHKDPNTDFHTWMSQITGLRRRLAKDNFFGVLYGMGGARLCRELGLPTKWVPSRRTGDMIEVAGDEGQAIIDQFERTVPWAKELSTKCKNTVEKRGYIITAGGRHIHFPKLPGGGFDWAHKGLNGLIQGSSADQVKMAMVAIDEAGIYLQLQEHDELTASVDTEKEAIGMAELMRDAMKLAVPVKVDVEVGQSWGEVKKIKVLT